MSRLPPWLDVTFAGLAEALDAQRLPHALLIHGPGGWGETVLAEALALHLIERSTADATAATLAHPDLRWIVPEGAGEQIGIDAVRAVADFIVHTPQIAPRKAAVITSADAMNGHAANALLKILEEPPPDSYLILVSDSLRDLLPTLRSRCRMIPVRPTSEAIALSWIRAAVPDGEADRIAALVFEYGGAPYKVLAALERDEQPISSALVGVSEGRMDPLAVADVFAKDGSVEVVDRWMRCVTQMLRLRRLGNRATDALVHALDGASEKRLMSLWEHLAADRRLLRGTTNPNVRLLFESRLLEWRDLTGRV